MIPPTIAILALACLLAALLTLGRRRLGGPPWARQLQLGLAAAVLVAGFGAWAVPRYGPDAPDSWEVGALRADGLRLVPSGRADASAVIDPASFEHPMSRELYGIAAEIPDVLNQLYCWCGCVKHGRHRSALACFEDRSAIGCGVCQETARIAWREMQRGVRDPARIQRAVDVEWAPPEARDEMAAYAAARGWDDGAPSGGGAAAD